MTIDTQSQEQADYLAEKLGSLLKELRARSSWMDKISIGLQVMQFVVVSVVGTAVTWYADKIKTQQEAHNETITQQLREEENRAAKAKVVLEFMPALADPTDKLRPKIALKAIETFIDLGFANQLTGMVATPALKEGLVVIQDQRQAQVEPVAQPATPDAKPQESGWVYLGNYDPVFRDKPWQTQYFVVHGQETDSDTLPTPDELAKGKIIHVSQAVAEANLRNTRPQNGVKLDQNSVIRHVGVKDLLTLDHVEPVAGTKLYWGHVTMNPK